MTSRQAKHIKKKRAEWRKQGFCGRCGKPAAEGLMHCRKCLDNRRDRQRAASKLRIQERG